MPEGEQSLSIMTFGSTKEQTQVCSVVRLGLTSKDKVTIPLTLFAVPLICEPVTSRPISFCQNDFDHLVGIDLAECPDSCANLEIYVLIGSDQYWELVSGGIRRGNSGPVAICTKLGWVLSGPISSRNHDMPATCFVTHSLGVNDLSQSLDDRLRWFWDLESFGIMDPEHSVSDEFVSTIQLVEGRYEVQLPWKEGHPTLPVLMIWLQEQKTRSKFTNCM